MSWVVVDGKPVKVRWEGSVLVRVDGSNEDIDTHTEVFGSRREARESISTSKPPTIDKKLKKLATILGAEAMGYDDIFLPLNARAAELVQDYERLVSQLTTSRLDRDSAYRRLEVLDHELQERINANSIMRVSLAGEKKAVTDLTAQLKTARMEIFALELKAEALHCHQIMLVAERERLRKQVKEQE